MDIEIILNSEERRDAIREYLLNKHGIKQEWVGAVKYYESGKTISGDIVCSGISGITKAIEVSP